MKLAVPVISKILNLAEDLQKAVPNYTFYNARPEDGADKLKDAEIIVADFDLIGPHLYKLEQTKWIQATWAGVDGLLPFLKKNKPLPFDIVKFTGHHMGSIMSEYVVANVINFERRMFATRKNQESQLWDKFETYRTIYDLTFGIMGIGNVGSKVGKLLHYMGGVVLGYGRRPEQELQGDISFLTKYYSKGALPEFLSQCHYVINILPSTPHTIGLLKGDMLKHCQDKQSVFINIGRGTIIPEEDLVRALNEKWISGAILDVFETEPLPQESPLWKFDQVFITPHVAGSSRSRDIAEEFKKNLNLHTQGLPFPTKFDISKGY